MYGTTYQDKVEKEAEVRALRIKRQQLAADTTNDRGVVNRLIGQMDDEIRKLQHEISQCAANLPLSQPGSHLSGRHQGTPSAGFRSMGELFQCIATAGAPSGFVDPRLHEIRATGLSESVSGDGGFLVGTDYSREILETTYETGKLARLCRRIPISTGSNSIRLPGLDESSRAAGSRHGGVLSYWLPEAGEKQASKPKFRLITLELKKQVVLVYATDELLQDAAALEEYLRRVAPAEIAFNMDDAILNGTGAGQPLGILNSGALVTQAKEVGQAAGTVLLENVTKMWSRMFGSSRGNAVWLVNQSVEPQLYQMSLAVGTGGAPVFLPSGGVSAAPFMTLFGRPIVPVEQCPQLGTKGDIILASFQDGYLLAEKGGVQVDVSIHVRFQFDESVYRWVYRVDGQPVLASPITPFVGGAALSQSHFVALESRS